MRNQERYKGKENRKSVIDSKNQSSMQSEESEKEIYIVSDDNPNKAGKEINKNKIKNNIMEYDSFNQALQQSSNISKVLRNYNNTSNINKNNKNNEYLKKIIKSNTHLQANSSSDNNNIIYNNINDLNDDNGTASNIVSVPVKQIKPKRIKPLNKKQQEELHLMELKNLLKKKRERDGSTNKNSDNNFEDNYNIQISSNKILLDLEQSYHDNQLNKKNKRKNLLCYDLIGECIDRKTTSKENNLLILRENNSSYVNDNNISNNDINNNISNSFIENSFLSNGSAFNDLFHKGKGTNDFIVDNLEVRIIIFLFDN